MQRGDSARPSTDPVSSCHPLPAASTDSRRSVLPSGDSLAFSSRYCLSASYAVSVSFRSSAYIRRRHSRSYCFPLLLRRRLFYDLLHQRAVSVPGFAECPYSRFQKLPDLRCACKSVDLVKAKSSYQRRRPAKSLRRFPIPLSTIFLRGRRLLAAYSLQPAAPAVAAIAVPSLFRIQARRRCLSTSLRLCRLARFPSVNAASVNAASFCRRRGLLGFRGAIAFVRLPIQRPAAFPPFPSLNLRQLHGHTVLSQKPIFLFLNCFPPFCFRFIAFESVSRAVTADTPSAFPAPRGLTH